MFSFNELRKLKDLVSKELIDIHEKRRKACSKCNPCNQCERLEHVRCEIHSLDNIVNKLKILIDKNIKENSQ
jgi:hypothetical protein